VPGALVLGTVFAFLISPLSASADTLRVVIENMNFVPEAAQAKPGDTILFENKDIVPHTVTAVPKNGKKPLFDSGAIEGGKTFKLKLRHAGDFPYVCRFHPTMKASIHVSK
jgi:plastocyanin